MENPWPPDVPWSLWHYRTLSVSEIDQVPMMGVDFAPSFLYAFAFGCFFVVFFAWKRFVGRSEEIPFASETLAALQPNNLGSRNAVVRAYIIYAGAILVLYIALTFFGKLILQASALVQTAGITVDAEKLRFDSFEWPLTLAFAFAGFAELLPPVRLAESWLRNRAYRAAGIPVRLEQTTRSLIATLEDASSRGMPDAPDMPDPLALALAEYKQSWRARLEDGTTLKGVLLRRPAREAELMSLLAQIELLIHWAKTARGKWPGTEVSQAVRGAEDKLVFKADEALNLLQARVAETQSTEKDQPAQTGARSRFDAAQLGRLDADLSQTAEELRKIRYDLVSILAIYIERDPDVPGANPRRPGKEPVQSDAALAGLLYEADRPETAGQGPEAVLLVMLVPTFLVYAIAAWQGRQELASVYIDPENGFGILSTAFIETLRVASLTWLPLLAAFSLRQYYWDSNDWAGAPKAHSRTSYLLQQAGCLTLALAVSIICLSCVALLRAFAIAPDLPYFLSYLFRGTVPFLLYYPSQAVIVIPLVPLCLMAADARARGGSGGAYAVAAGIAVFFVSTRHTYFWDEDLADRCRLAAALAQPDCFRRVEAVGHLLLGFLAFLATWLMGAGRRDAPQAAVSCVAALAAGLAALAVPSPVAAQEGKIPQVVIGFRTDVEPFSYAIDYGERDGKKYFGFVADLCYKIFNGMNYNIESVPVTAENRFDRLFTTESRVKLDTRDDHHKGIDILCDAVTMRFSDTNRDGVYSPIIFASGVSYLDGVARSRSSGVSLGYVRNTTALDVAMKSCETDLFKALLPAHRDGLYERCSFAKQATELLYAIPPDVRAHDLTNKDVMLGITDLRDAASAVVDVLKEKKDEITTRDRATKVLEFLKPHCPDGACTLPPALLPDFRGLLTDEICAGKVPDAPKLTAQQQWLDYHFCPQQGHPQLVEWLCRGKDQRRVSVGDREIIQAKLASWQEENGPCGVEAPQGAPYLTYEPYALLIAEDRPDLIRLVQKRIHQLFSHRDAITAQFQSYFPDHRMSPALAYLFLLNAVEQEQEFLTPDEEPAVQPDGPRDAPQGNVTILSAESAPPVLADQAGATGPPARR